MHRPNETADPEDVAAVLEPRLARWARQGLRRTAIDRDRRLVELAARITALSPRLVDAWEATAILESLGYGDRAVQDEFGLSDTRGAGEYIFRATSTAAGRQHTTAMPAGSTLPFRARGEFRRR
jgi:hypothetical protein